MPIAALPALLLPLAGMSATTCPQDADVGRQLAVAQGVISTAADGLFPTAAEDLALAWPADGEKPSMLDLVVQYGRLTGQRMVFSQDTQQYLQQVRIPIDRPTTVAAADIQGFFESIMISSDFVLTIDRAEAPRLVGVHSLNTSHRNTIRQRALPIPCDDLATLRAHPALIFSTAVNLPNTDVRQLSNSMRTMITDANTQQMLPAGNSSTMMLVGFGPQIAGLIDHLKLIDAASEQQGPAGIEVSHAVIKLKHAMAGEVANIVEAALAAAQSIRTPAGPQMGGPQGPQMARQPASVLQVGRLNAVLVTCAADQMEEARRVIAMLDVEQ